MSQEKPVSAFQCSPEQAERAVLISRVAAGAFLLLLVVLFYLGSMVHTYLHPYFLYKSFALLQLSLLLAKLLWPLAPGLAVIALNLSNWNDGIERGSALFTRRLDVARGKEGKFARFFSRPLWRGCLWIWAKTEGIEMEGVRAGVRVSLATYFVGIMVSLLLAAVYILVAVVVFLAMIFFVFWIISLGSNSPDRNRGNDVEDRSPMSRVRTSRKAEGFFGTDPHLEHFDEHGKKVAETRKVEGFFGTDPHEVTTDMEGNKVAEGRYVEGFFGTDPHVRIEDAEGNFAGERRHREGFFGTDPYAETTDADGNVVSTARHEDGFFGLDPHTEHTPEK